MSAYLSEGLSLSVHEAVSYLGNVRPAVTWLYIFLRADTMLSKNPNIRSRLSDVLESTFDNHFSQKHIVNPKPVRFVGNSWIMKPMPICEPDCFPDYLPLSLYNQKQ